MQDIRTLTIKQVAATLCVSERHIARLIAAKKLQSLTIGRRRLIRRHSLTAWLNGLETVVR